MDDQDLLERFGLPAARDALPAIRTILEGQITAERGRQGSGDTELMKLCCVQLFSGGEPGDALLIWRAKTASMDADGSIDIQLLCGAGLDETRGFLETEGSEIARAALGRLAQAEAAGDFADFSAGDLLASYQQYYAEDGGGAD